MTDHQVTLVGGLYDGMTIDDPGTGFSFTMLDVTKEPGDPDAEIRYIIRQLEPDVKAYIEGWKPGKPVAFF
jgi:hypothetical protein